MLIRNLPLCVVFILSVASLPLTAQEVRPPLYLGPYQQPSVEQFMGEWNRSDGDYKLVIEEEEGSLKAAYLNPNPIKVEATTVAEVDGTLQVTIVLRDQGYPGSTYVLEYMPEYRVLAGTYTIPGQAPSEVYFTK